MDFDFAFVDGVSSLGAEQAHAAIARVGSITVSQIGPILEFEYLRRQPNFRHLSQSAQLTTAPVAALVGRAIDQNTPLVDTSINARDLEVARLPQALPQNAVWSAFLRRLVSAAKLAGFEDVVAKGLAGAFGELADNALDHSDLAGSALVAYQWRCGAVEMAIIDAGIGIRASLRKNPNHAGLVDDQIALEQALTMGVTRYPDGTGHGTGFKTVFDALAGLGGMLRFRSGAAVLLLDGTDFGRLKRKLIQRDYYQGFAATICCAK